jgi:hypothetical protein
MSDPSESLIEYPCDFPIKVMAVAQAAQVDLVEAIAAVAIQYDPGFKADTITTRPSAKGNYLGLTITVRATSRTQLDALYQALSSHSMVKMVL